MSIIQYLKNEIKTLKENKENVDPLQRRIKKITQELLDPRMQHLSTRKAFFQFATKKTARTQHLITKWEEFKLK